MVTLLEPTEADIARIACFMRGADCDEIWNAVGHNNPFILARTSIDAIRMGSGVVAAVEGRPVAVLGVTPVRPGICNAFAFGTNDFNRVALSLTRYALRVVKPALIRAGFHRLECQSRYDHCEAHAWLERLGFAREGVLRKSGSDGSDYIQFGAIYDVPTEAQEAARASK